MSQLSASGGQSFEVSASASVLPMNTQDYSPSEWTGWISLQSKGLSRVFSSATVQKHQFFSAQLSSQSKSYHPYMTTGKTIALTRWTFVGKVMSLLLSMLSRLAITFLQSCPTLQLHGLQPASLLCPWASPGKNTGVGCHALHQGIFQTQVSNLHLRGSCIGFFTTEPPGKPT